MRRFVSASLFVGAVLAMPAAFAAGSGSDALYPSQLLKSKPTLKTQYDNLVAPIQAQHGWVSSMGTETPVSRITIEGADYAVLSGCKPHDCSGESLVSLMTPSSDQAVGALVVNQGQQAMGPKSSKIIWLGQPDRPQRRFIAAYLFR
ncbi:Ivy family c-type lysozyme inhibitor [Salinisphaera hydrothermalis]|uniref:Ivy family c-type lysozyme inhibitor n=1 Tax=Salinisphaera hydrothermalis TaxID=563188 RepID=UPI0033409579